MSFATEVAFSLPRGYVDTLGRVHREGIMRLATARDEIDPLQDPRAQQNTGYLPILLLSRVIRRLGELTAVTPEVIEQLYVSDLMYLEDLYQRINSPEPVVVGVVCPQCSERLHVQVAPLG
jgi:hypothetical protein